MPSKWFKNDWSIAGFLLFFTQLGWAVYLVSIIVYSLLLIIELFGFAMVGVFDLPARVDIDDLAQFVKDEEMTVFQNSTFETQISALNEGLRYQWTY